MAASVGVLAHQHVLPLLGREPGLVDRDLVLLGIGESAAVAVTGTPVSWQPIAGFDAPVAAGAVMPVCDAYRSVRCRICRDVRQSVEHSERPLEQQVTLCREDQGANLFVWLVAEGDR